MVSELTYRDQANWNTFLSRSHRREWLILVVVPIFCAVIAEHISAFRIFFLGAPPVHEDITMNAVWNVTPQTDENFVFNVVQGLENTDIYHQFDAQYHFDDSVAPASDGTSGNGGFESGFNNVQSLLRTAETEARQMYCPSRACGSINPAFLGPQHLSLADMQGAAADALWDIGLSEHCTFSSTCPSEDIIGLASDLDVNPVTLVDASPDPDVFDVAGELVYETNSLEGILNQLGNDSHFSDDISALSQIDNELHAYPAWQHLGHAFHGVQDFFAHSNYVELAAGLTGPPCPQGQSSNCATTPIRGVPPDHLVQFVNPFTSSIKDFMSQFWLDNVQKTLQSSPAVSKGARFETGYVNWVGDWCYSQYMVTNAVGAARPTNPNPLPGFEYCHYQTTTVPGLNKDEAYQKERPDDELAHQNYDYSYSAATRVSQGLWSGFLGDLGGSSLLASLGYSSGSGSSSPHVIPVVIVRDYHEHDSTFGSKGDDSLNSGLRLIAGPSDCVLQNVEVQVVTKRGDVVAAARQGADAVGSDHFPHWGARITSSGVGTKDLAVKIHWWQDVGVAVRYQVKYTFESPSGGVCSTPWR